MTWFDDALHYIGKSQPEIAGQLRDLGIPGPKAEGWQHAGLRQFFASERRLLSSTEGLQPSTTAAQADIVLWNGIYSPKMLPEGVSVSLETPGISRFLNVFDGIAQAIAPCIVISISKTLQKPLTLVSLVEGVLPSIISQSVRVRMLPDASAEVHVSVQQQGEGHLLLSSLCAEVGKNARLVVSDTSCNNLPAMIRSTQAVVAENGTFERCILGSTTGLSQEEISIELHREAAGHVRGLYLQQQLVSSVKSRIHHMQPNASSSQTFRSSVFGGARVSVDVTTQVDHDAGGTMATQESRHMLLASGARAYTVPRLVINTDDVQCKHGATVGHADTEQLAYMRARGVGDQRARSLLAFGHIRSLLAAFPVDLQPALEVELRKHLLLS